jgi:hypothetical protein
MKKSRFHVHALGAVLLAATAPLAAANRLYFVNQTAQVQQAGITIPVRADTDQERHGFSLSIKYDPAVLAITSVTTAGTAAATAEWSDGRILAAKGAISWGVVMDLSDPLTKVIPAGDNQVLALITADVLPTQPTTTAITPQDGLDSPPGGWINLFSYRGVNTLPQLSGGTITIVAGNRFLLGDCNADGKNQPDLSDSIYLLTHLFLGGPAPACRVACDANSDGTPDLSDAIYLLTYLFLGGPAPREPFPACDSAALADCATEICAA